MERNLAVLIDFENIAAATEKDGLGRFDVQAILARVKDKGRVLVARSYADWGRFARFKQDLLRANVTMYELTSHGMQDKNRADIAMVVDCLELALTRDYISTYVIVSGDSDFTPLAQKLREHNKRVIGCGCRSSTSRLLIEACDEFFFYDNLVQGQRQRRQNRNRGRGNRMTREMAYELAAEAVQGLQRENPDPPLASVVKGAMLRKSPDFSENDLKFSSFARFLEAAQDAGSIRVIRDSKSGGYRVDLVETDGHANTADDSGPMAEPEVVPDEYMPEGVEAVVAYLESQGKHPMSTPTRRVVLEALEQVVQDRRKRRRRVTAKFVQEDVRKRIKKTRPDLPKQAIHGLFDCLIEANVLIHKDGTPIRSFQAPFTIEKNADQLNEALMGIYLAELTRGDVELPDSGTLAALFLGQAERAREVEEALAWLAAPPPASEAPEVPQAEQRTEALDLDDLLLFDVTEEVPATPVSSDLDALLESDDEVASSDEASSSEEVVAEAAPEPTEAPVEEEKPKTRRKRTRKKTETQATDAENAPTATETTGDATEASSTEDAAEAPAEEPAPKPRRRRTRRSTTTETKTTSEDSES